MYKFTYTMSLSILHRLTGVATSVGFVAFAWWLMALASGPESYADAMRCLSSPLAKLLLVGFTFSFVYHFCNGIRHLVWDTGRGLERAQARRSGDGGHRGGAAAHRAGGVAGLCGVVCELRHEPAHAIGQGPGARFGGRGHQSLVGAARNRHRA